MILQLIIDSLASGMLGAGTVMAVRKLKLRKPSIGEDGLMSWSAYQDDVAGFECPKCLNVHKNTGQPPICYCWEHHQEHFHFKCGDCGYTNILRTADDA